MKLNNLGSIGEFVDKVLDERVFFVKPYNLSENREVFLGELDEKGIDYYVSKYTNNIYVNLKNDQNSFMSENTNDEKKEYLKELFDSYISDYLFETPEKYTILDKKEDNQEKKEK